MTGNVFEAVRRLMGCKAAVETEEKRGNGPSAVDYVEWLLLYMLRTSRMEVALDTTRPLPPGSALRGGDNPPPCMPEVSVVINRIKLLSGLTPVWYAEPVEGRFERQHANHTLVVTTRFEDVADKSVCTVRLRIRA